MSDIVTFVPPTPENGSYVDESTEIQIAADAVVEGQVEEFSFAIDEESIDLFDGLVFLCNFDNRAELNEDASTVREHSPLNQTGVAQANAVPTVNGRHGGGMTFNGQSNSRLTFPWRAEYNSPWAMSWSFWVFNTGNSSWSAIWTNTEDSPRRSWVIVPEGNTMLINIYRYTDNVYHNFPGPSIPTNVWSHWVITYDGLAFRFYRNGVLETTTAEDRGISENTGDDMVIGRTPIWNNGFEGTYDEFMMWNRTLSAAEVSMLYRLRLAKVDENDNEWLFEYDAGLLAEASYPISVDVATSDPTASVATDPHTFHVGDAVVLQDDYETELIVSTERIDEYETELEVLSTDLQFVDHETSLEVVTAGQLDYETVIVVFTEGDVIPEGSVRATITARSGYAVITEG